MLQPGDSIGRYHIRRRLAHGGMGTLYVANDPVLDRDIALKLFLGDIDLPGARERFVREARAAASLSNPNIVTVYDYGDYASQPYIVMEYIHGETLAEVIHRKADIPISVKLRWIEELCSAVGYAHGRGIIHRDIKPSNLMIDSYGRLKVLDFGIARMRGSLASNTTALIGTPGYCAPEQIRGGEIDHRSDLFSIGVVSYELLAYAEPFQGETIHAITNRILNDEPAPLSQVCTGIDGELAETVERALRKAPDERFPSADMLRAALAGVRGRLEAESDATTVRYVQPTILLEAAAARAYPSSNQPQIDGGQRGPGSASAGTTAHDPRRTDREIAARRKVAQVQEQLTLARERLDAGDLHAAQRTCEQALALDAEHPEVRELCELVNRARHRSVSELLSAAREELALSHDSAVENLLEQLVALDGDHPAVPELALGLRVLRADQDRGRRRTQAFNAALEAAEAALSRNDLQEALGRAREALEIDPQSRRARQLEEGALQPLATVLVPRSTPRRPLVESYPRGEATVLRPTPSQTRPIRSEQANVPAGVARGPISARRTNRPSGGSILARWNALPVRQRRAVLASGAVILTLVVIAAAAISFSRSRSTVPPSLIVVDALPWASIAAVTSDSGEREALPDSASTPLPLRLPPGTYSVTLQGPPPQSELRTVVLRVESGKPVRFPPQRFSTITADQYFSSYALPAVPAPLPETPASEEAP